MKQCPTCKIELTQKVIGEIEVDECEKCKGIWFDAGELRLVKDIVDSDLNWMDFEVWKHQDDFKSKKSNINCPVCNTETKIINYGSTSIEIDYCPSCKGIWLGEDEFEKVIDALENELLTKSFSEYIKESIQEAKEIITGPESLLSEWKDFATVLRFMQYRMFVENPKLLEKIIAAQSANPFK